MCGTVCQGIKNLPYAVHMAGNEKDAGFREATARVVRGLRSRARIRQSDAARQIGVTSVTLGTWESGAREPKLSQLNQLAELYGVTLDDLISEVQTLRRDLQEASGSSGE